ncbi:MAG: SRPBCC family protein [Chloroflexota bacterium]|nr:MAG: SRPBCC family protein [Chloroflexota bacterium]
MEMNGTTVIGRPVETVFAYVIDVKNDVHWRNGVDGSGLRSGEPLGEGSVGYFRAGNQEIEWRVVSYVPYESIDWELLGGPFVGTGGYRVKPVEGGTQFTLVSGVEPSGAYKLLGPLFAWMGRRRNQADVEKLRAILESTAE